MCFFHAAELSLILCQVPKSLSSSQASWCHCSRSPNSETLSVSGLGSEGSGALVMASLVVEVLFGFFVQAVFQTVTTSTSDAQEWLLPRGGPVHIAASFLGFSIVTISDYNGGIIAVWLLICFGGLVSRVSHAVIIRSIILVGSRPAVVILMVGGHRRVGSGASGTNAGC